MTDDLTGWQRVVGLAVVGVTMAWPTHFVVWSLVVTGDVGWLGAVAMSAAASFTAARMYFVGRRDATYESIGQANVARRAREVTRSVALATAGRSLGLVPTQEQKRWN